MSYRDRAATEIRDEEPAVTLTPIMRKLVADSASTLQRGPADARQRAASARAHAVANLEALHAEVEKRFRDRGIGYHRVADAAGAVALVRELLGDARRVAKSKSMVAEEVGLTHDLRRYGIDVLETDIGEYIVDLEGRGPSHITAPALHLNRSRIRDILARKGGAELDDDDPVRLSRHVRDIVGEYFEDCDAAITGANAVVASSGRLVIVENEGNVSLGVSHPRTHIVITGIEKVVADEAGALATLEVLAPSATAQPLTAFSHFLADPLPGQQRHVVFVDNGRSAILADERYRDVLRCIRCGACMNGCPVYRAAGGLSYGSPYMGPIGAVISPLLWPDGRFADLPGASSLCGRCTEVCPVGIALHRMLLDLRADGVKAGKASRKERAIWKVWRLTYAGETRARLASTLARLGLRGAGRIVRPRGSDSDPRVLPDVHAVRNDEALTHPRAQVEMALFVEETVEPATLADLFLERAATNGAEIVERLRERKGDLRLSATAAVASTGSILLTGEATLRRPLLAATRLVVEVEPGTIVRHPSQLEPFLGDGEALILTGASRTADIEKQIVRGIHGTEQLVIVWKRPTDDGAAAGPQ